MNTFFKPVNWMQGMSVSSSHFIATENFLNERLMNCIKLLQGDFQYGLMPSADDEEPEMMLSVVGKGSGAKVVLYSYHGLTPGGCPIHLDVNNETVSCYCQESSSLTSEGWDVVLSIAPFERRPCGEPDIHEEPPRYPYVEPIYKLSLFERDKEYVNSYGPFDVLVGFLRKKDDEYKLDGNFIPPSLTMNSCPLLQEYMRLFSQQISSIKERVDTILTKSYSPNANRSDVLLNVVEICKTLQLEIARVYFKWHNEAWSLSPAQTIEIISTIANVIQTSLMFMSKQNKEDVLTYFHEWNGITPSAFEQVLDDLVRMKFNQNRIGLSMIAARETLDMLNDLFISLSKLDYVGQHRESIVVSVSSTKEETTQGKKSSWLL